MDLLELRKFESGTRHPWERARLRLVRWLLPKPAPHKLLDVGCGDGFVVGSLQDSGAVVGAIGVDPLLEDAQRQVLATTWPGVSFARELPADADADAASLLDVLEHVGDDGELLRSVVDAVAPGATVVITVPAHPGLFSAHDRMMLHHRRYSRAALLDLIQGAGLSVVSHGYWFSSLLPIRLGQVTMERLLGPPKREGRSLAGWAGGELGARLVAAILTGEGIVLWACARMGIRIPGLSLWAVCRKPR